MSQSQPPYDTGGAVPASLDAFKGRPCVLPFSDPNYIPPTPGEIDQLIKLCEWSQNDTAKLVGITYNPKKGSSTIRKWRAKTTSDDYRAIPYSAWRLLLLYAGVVSVEAGLKAVDRV